MVVDSTANPYKFVGAVWQGVTGDAPQESDLKLLTTLSEKTGEPIHRALANLTEKEKCERTVITVADINDVILKTIQG